MTRNLSKILFIILACATYSVAHPFLPLEVGTTSVFAYRSHVDAANKLFQTPDVTGEMSSQIGPQMKRGELSYHQILVSYSNIPAMAQGVVLYKREENGAVHVGSQINARWIDTVELPADVSIGKEWDYFDGVASKRKVTGKTSFSLGGRVFPDCIEVTRYVLGDERYKDAENKSVYCAGIGEVSFLFTMNSPIGRYRTETVLTGQKLTPPR